MYCAVNFGATAKGSNRKSFWGFGQYLRATAWTNKELSDNFLTKKEDYNFIEVDNDYVLTSIKDIILKALEKGYREKDIQVLAPMYKSQNGIDNLNKMLQEIFNPKSNDKNELIVGNKIFL